MTKASIATEIKRIAGAGGRARTLAAMLALIALMVAATACDAGATATSSPEDAVTPTRDTSNDPIVGEPFTLQLGGSVYLDSAGYHVTFTRVTQDGRCPAGNDCVSPGAVTIDLAVQVSDSGPEWDYLFSIGDPTFEPASRTIGGFEIELTDVSPPPGGTPGPSEATLVAHRA